MSMMHDDVAAYLGAALDQSNSTVISIVST